jgi:hypothetical protein
LLLLKYAHQYKQITLQETGKVGSLFYGWLVSINAAWFGHRWSCFAVSLCDDDNRTLLH